ncbi:cathelicidin-related antimicrobial peptide Bf-CRAMP-like isoform X1 [Eleutherodactylus coqui]|uniref:cathelicidin-related antimicrobial peptide Bf-CRAMP-like isoform X1 n=1 Tax=Eleutherodactylus coqui TaxID=57060 RepID=UPI003462FE4B
MRSWKLSLLFFSAVTLHGCLSGAAEPEVQDERSIRDIINLYNKREGVTYLYKYLDQISITPLEGDENQRGFIIKETECLKSGNPDLSQCDFKPDGDVKICILDAEVPDDIKCISLPENVRVRRSSRRLCWRRHCWARLTGRFTLIARPSSNQKIPGLILV